MLVSVSQEQIDEGRREDVHPIAIALSEKTGLSIEVREGGDVFSYPSPRSKKETLLGSLDSTGKRFDQDFVSGKEVKPATFAVIEPPRTV